MKEVFIAYNSKKVVLIFVFIALLFFTLSVVFLFIKMEIKAIAVTVSALIGLYCVGESLHFFYQPEIAIKATDKEIIFYKHNKIFKYSIDDIVKVRINITSYSFDTRIYTKSKQRKGFHFLIINSSKKRDEYIRYFKYRGIKVETETYWID